MAPGNPASSGVGRAAKYIKIAATAVKRGGMRKSHRHSPSGTVKAKKVKPARIRGEMKLTATCPS